MEYQTKRNLVNKNYKILNKKFINTNKQMN